MKKYIFSFLLLINSTLLFAYPRHSPQLATPIKLLYQFEETQSLLNQAEAQGALTIEAAQMGMYASNAAWFPDERRICINLSNKRSQSSILCSIVFEIHNALSQNQFDYLDQLVYQGKIHKEDYIQSVEHIEYLNALKTSKVLRNGVNLGIFSWDTEYPVAPTFNEHLAIQRQAGHSQFIGELWQSLSRNRRS